MRIEPYEHNRLNAIKSLSVSAWAPVFDSLEKAMDSDVYRLFYPDGWRVSQLSAVESVCTSADNYVWVALESDSTVGFIAVKLHLEDSMGEIYMIAVDPDYQRRGIGAALTQFALDWMKEKGMSIAMVETGGDSGHAPARCTYEKMGFGLLPIARYFKKL